MTVNANEIHIATARCVATRARALEGMRGPSGERARAESTHSNQRKHARCDAPHERDIAAVFARTVLLLAISAKPAG